MNKNFKRMMSLFVCLVMSLSLAIPAFAAEDNIAFNFKMKGNLANNYTSDSRLRDTTRTNNPWKVNMTYNSEDAGAIATFWLAKSSIPRTQYSNAHSIKQGSGNHYYSVYETASGNYTCLAVRNNNNVSTSYTVGGYWDEETGGTI